MLSMVLQGVRQSVLSRPALLAVQLLRLRARGRSDATLGVAEKKAGGRNRPHFTASLVSPSRLSVRPSVPLSSTHKVTILNFHFLLPRCYQDRTN